MRLGRIRHDTQGVRVEASGRRMLVVSVFMAIFAVGIGAATVIEDSWWTRLLYGAVALGFGAIALSGLWQSRRPTIPMITVRDEGIEHVKAGLIRWDDIEDVRAVLDVREPHARDLDCRSLPRCQASRLVGMAVRRAQRADEPPRDRDPELGRPGRGLAGRDRDAAAYGESVKRGAR